MAVIKVDGLAERMVRERKKEEGRTRGTVRVCIVRVLGEYSKHEQSRRRLL